MFDLFTCVLSYGSRKRRMEKVNLDRDVQRLWFFSFKNRKHLDGFFGGSFSLGFPNRLRPTPCPRRLFLLLVEGIFSRTVQKFPPPPSSPPTAQALVPTRNKCRPFHSIQTAKSRQLWDHWERERESGSIKPPSTRKTGFWVLPKRHELVLSTYALDNQHEPLTHERKSYFFFPMASFYYGSVRTTTTTTATNREEK